MTVTRSQNPSEKTPVSKLPRFLTETEKNRLAVRECRQKQKALERSVGDVLDQNVVANIEQQKLEEDRTRKKRDRSNDAEARQIAEGRLVQVRKLKKKTGTIRKAIQSTTQSPIIRLHQEWYQQGLLPFLVKGAALNGAKKRKNAASVRKRIQKLLPTVPAPKLAPYVEITQEAAVICDTPENRNILCEHENNDVDITSREDMLRILEVGVGRRSKPQSPEDFKAARSIREIKLIKLGSYSGREGSHETLHFSPYLISGSETCMCVCGNCFQRMQGNICAGCPFPMNPPGKEIYRHESTVVFLVDGIKSEEFCQNLSLLARLFIESKCYAYLVQSFNFYCLYEQEKEKPYHFVGFFSKAKNDMKDFNLSCLFIYPAFQRKGAGWFLVSLSFALSQVQAKVGFPESPNSVAQKLYSDWICHAIFKQISQFPQRTLQEMSVATGIDYSCIVASLSSRCDINYDDDGNAALLIKLADVTSAVEERERRLKEGGFDFKIECLSKNLK